MEVVLQRLIENRPLAVMTRCITEDILNGDLDTIFNEHRQRQYEKDLLFSHLGKAIADVVLGLEASPRQAYLTHKALMKVSATAFYDKLKGVELPISEALVRHAYAKTEPLLGHLGSTFAEPIEGYRARVIDGNHLQQTQKRLGALRGLACAALPGTAVVTYEVRSGLFDRAYLLEDAHAQESSALSRVGEDLQENDLLLGDRHFCIVNFLVQITARKATFLIRQHGRLKGVLVGRRRKIGRIETGTVYEQDLLIGATKDTPGLRVRRVSVELDQPTRDGDTEIHLLTNVPVAAADGCRLAAVYRQRWEIENAFYRLTTTLTCEVKTLGHPRAALFVFCMALVAANSARLLTGALSAAQGEEVLSELSAYSLACEIEKSRDSVDAVLTDDEWSALVPREPASKAQFLVEVARHVDLPRHQKSRRGPKKPPPKRTGYVKGGHVSTAKLLQARSQSP